MSLYEFIRERLDAQVLHDPHRQAIADQDSSVTFQELRDAVAERAHSLLCENQTLAHDSFVPIPVRADVSSAIDVLACMAAGLPFSPLDSELPAARRELLDRILGYVDGDSKLETPAPADNRFRESTPRIDGQAMAEGPWPQGKVVRHETSLVLLSSGSTGTPKAIAFAGHTVTERIKVFEERLAPHSKQSRVLVVSPFHFIAGLLDLSAVLSGAYVVIRDPSRMNPKDMVRVIAAEQVTHLMITPPYARLLAMSATSDTQKLDSLSVLSLTGDTAHFEDISALAHLMKPTAHVKQIFGASEGPPSFVFSETAANVPKSGRVPLGIMPDPENTHLEPHENGLFEVWRRGPILSGYLKSPELNARHIIDDGEGGTWWKSGDLIAQDPSGNWFFHSRMDDTIKVRGVLASPSEIHATLLSHPRVDASVVLVDEKDGRKRFVAHIETTPYQSITDSELRSYLEDRLPGVLVPSRFIFHQKIPLNARGKVNREALRKLH